MTGISLTTGILENVFVSELSSNPANAKDWPSRSSTPVFARRVFRPGIMKPLNFTPLAKSIVETSGSSSNRIWSSSRIVGLKFSRTPYSLNTTVMAMLPPEPPPWTTGTGNSPPARKLACCPSIAIRLGSARSRKAPCVRSTRSIAAVLIVRLKTKRFNAGDITLSSMVETGLVSVFPSELGPPPLLIYPAVPPFGMVVNDVP